MTVHLEGKPHYILTATCDSRMGTVARVSGFLASRTCYITDMQQFDDVMTGRFFTRISFYGNPGSTPELEELRTQFQVLALQLNSYIHLHPDQLLPRRYTF